MITGLKSKRIAVLKTSVRKLESELMNAYLNPRIKIERKHTRAQKPHPRHSFVSRYNSRHNSFLRVSFKFSSLQLQSPHSLLSSPLFLQWTLRHFVAVSFRLYSPTSHAVAKQSRRFSVCRFPRMKRQSQDKVAEYKGCEDLAAVLRPPTETVES